MCARHVYANLRKQWRGLAFREVFWKIAKSINEVLFKNAGFRCKGLGILTKERPKIFL